MYFVVGNYAEHSGRIVCRTQDEPCWPAPGGWTWQDITGPYGSVLSEHTSEAEAVVALDTWLECDSSLRGEYCYTHNPLGEPLLVVARRAGLRAARKASRLEAALAAARAEVARLEAALAADRAEANAD